MLDFISPELRDEMSTRYKCIFKIMKYLPLLQQDNVTLYQNMKRIICAELVRKVGNVLKV